MSLIELLRRFEEVYSTQKGLPWIGTVRPEQAFGRAIAELEAMQAEIGQLREELRLWLILVDEGGVPRYTVQPGAALNTVVTSTKRLVARASLHGQEQ